MTTIVVYQNEIAVDTAMLVNSKSFGCNFSKKVPGGKYSTTSCNRLAVVLYPSVLDERTNTTLNSLLLAQLIALEETGGDFITLPVNMIHQLAAVKGTLLATSEGIRYIDLVNPESNELKLEWLDPTSFKARGTGAVHANAAYLAYEELGTPKTLVELIAKASQYDVYTSKEADLIKCKDLTPLLAKPKAKTKTKAEKK